MMSFHERLELRMRTRGISYSQACREMGAAGGRRAALNKRLARAKAKKFHEEQRRQAARGLIDKDDLLDDNLNRRDRLSIAMDQGKRRVG